MIKIDQCLLLLLIFWTGLSSGEIVHSVEPEGEIREPDFADLHSAGIIRRAVLSPGGQLVAYMKNNSLMVGGPQDGYHQIFNFKDHISIHRLQWGADNVILADFKRDNSPGSELYAVEVGFIDGEFGLIRDNIIDASGFVFDPLPNQPELVVFAKIREHEDSVATDLFRLSVFEDTGRQFKRGRRLNQDTNNIFYFLQSPNGELLHGIAFAEGKAQIWKRADSSAKWEHVWTAPEEASFEPYAVSDDGNTLWLLSNVSTDKIAVVAFDLTTASPREVVYENSRYDVYDILFSNLTDAPIGVTYFAQGILRYHFFEEAPKASFGIIQSQFPGQGIVITGYSEDELMQLVYVSSAQNPGEIHICNVDRASCALVEPIKPWLKDVELAETVALAVQSTDGLIIDAFLTLPVSEGESVPLLAVPHGGPIGVTDDQYYSGEVQWLAHNGYAILQVNYRGSGGYGRRFEAAGLREWGRGIEDDIEASIALALDEYPQLDAERIGIFGSSYGGYSALMSVIKRPDLYRCAASFAGVTDLTLLFNRADVRNNEELRERLIEMVGDPSLDYGELTSYSPVYQYEKFERPLFIAHGNSDPVVDIEHSWRLRMMLRLIGVYPEFHVLDRIGHGFEYVSEARELYDPLVSFFDKHLKPGAIDSDGGNPESLH